MTRKKIRLLYAAYIISTVIFFLYYLFPSEDVRDYIVLRINGTNPDIEVSMKRIKPSFPPGLRLYDLTVYHKNNLFLEAEEIKITPRILPLLKGEASINYSCAAYDGNITGYASMPLKESGWLDINADLDNIQINRIFALKDYFQHNISGRLSGDIKYKRDAKYMVSGASEMLLKDCSVEFMTPLYGLNSLSFSQIDTGLVLDKNRLKISRITGTGNDLDGDISGSVIIRKSLDKSILSLNGEILPHQALLGRLGKMANIKGFLKSKSGKEGIGFRISGTPGNPRFSLK